MMKLWSSDWKSSKKPSKQRKYRFNAHPAIRRRFMNVHLTKDLRKNAKACCAVVRIGDEVTVLKGEYKGFSGKVDGVNYNRSKVFIENVKTLKANGTKVSVGISPSNLIITKLNFEDNLRKKSVVKLK